MAPTAIGGTPQQIDQGTDEIVHLVIARPPE